MIETNKTDAIKIAIRSGVFSGSAKNARRILRRKFSFICLIIPNTISKKISINESHLMSIGFFIQPNESLLLFMCKSNLIDHFKESEFL